MDSNIWFESFMALWNEVWTETQAPGPSVDSIAQSLLSKKSLQQDAENISPDQARSLVFAILGWQTMLYRPDFGSCSGSQLAIADETNGYRGHAHMCLKQYHTACKKALCDFLKGFGVMLPCQNFSALSTDDDKHAFERYSTFSPTTLNAHLLCRVGRFNIAWTDSLSCHLELDRSSNTLYIFRYPSFCLVQLEDAEAFHTTLHACATHSKSDAHWATASDVNIMLEEVLLSYRLLLDSISSPESFFVIFIHSTGYRIKDGTKPLFSFVAESNALQDTG